jgi:hypothetical protein
MSKHYLELSKGCICVRGMEVAETHSHTATLPIRQMRPLLAPDKVRSLNALQRIGFLVY